MQMEGETESGQVPAGGGGKHALAGQLGTPGCHKPHTHHWYLAMRALTHRNINFSANCSGSGLIFLNSSERGPCLSLITAPALKMRANLVVGDSTGTKVLGHSESQVEVLP